MSEAVYLYKNFHKNKTLKDSKMDLGIFGVCYMHTMLKSRNFEKEILFLPEKDLKQFQGQPMFPSFSLIQSKS